MELQAAARHRQPLPAAALVTASHLRSCHRHHHHHRHAPRHPVTRSPCTCPLQAERYVGVTSGGMDQAISMMGQQGVAMHVEFNPVGGGRGRGGG